MRKLNERALRRADIKRWVRQGKSIKVGGTWYTVMRASKTAEKLMLVTSDWELQKGKKASSKFITYDDLLKNVNGGNWMVKINDKPVGNTVSESGLFESLNSEDRTALISIISLYPPKNVSAMNVDQDYVRKLSGANIKTILQDVLKRKRISADTRIASKHLLSKLSAVTEAAQKFPTIIRVWFATSDEARLYRSAISSSKGIGEVDSDMYVVDVEVMNAAAIKLAGKMANAYNGRIMLETTSGDVGGFVNAKIGALTPKPFGSSKKKRRSAMKESMNPGTAPVMKVIKKLGYGKYVHSIKEVNQRVVVKMLGNAYNKEVKAALVKHDMGEVVVESHQEDNDGILAALNDNVLNTKRDRMFEAVRKEDSTRCNG